MVQQKKSPKMQDLKLDEFLMMVDVATTIRQKQEEVTEQLNINEVRDKLKRRLQETAQVSGEKLTDFQIESAINNYLDGLYSFQEPQRDFGTKVAELYVERGRLAKKFGIPPLVGIAAVGVIWTSLEIIESARLKSQERGVESAVETAYQERQKLLVDTQEILSSPFVVQLPTAEKNKLESQLSNSQERLNSMSSFFQKYCSDGTSEDDVTKENYKEAENNLTTTKDFINKTKTEIQEGRLVIQTQESLILTHRNLETLIGEIRGLKPLETFSKRAEGVYSAGIGEIERRSLNEARKKQVELFGVKDDITQFSNLTSQTESLYGSIRAVVKEEEASQKGEALYKEARQVALSADVPRLSQIVSQLQNLNTILNQEYTLRIVNRSDMRSGIDRYYTDKSGKRVSGYYLIVEGIDARGNALQIDVRNEEDGQTKGVTMWGERIPQEVYEKVKEDKIDNGIINNDIVGNKKRGYLKEEMIMRGVTKQGQITSW